MRLISLRGRLHRHVASFPVLKNDGEQIYGKIFPLLCSQLPLPINYILARAPIVAGAKESSMI